MKMLRLYSRTNDPERVCDSIANHSNKEGRENISEKFRISEIIGLFEGFFGMIE